MAQRWLMFADGHRRLSEALRAHVATEATPGPGDLLGLELEFSVRSDGGARVHFGSLIHHLPLDGSTFDPGDRNAYRCSWGGVITADGAEAEIATPPVWTRPGFTGELQAWAQAGEAELRSVLPRGLALDGYSAHFSAAMPARLNDRVCRLYAQTFAAGLMLLTDRSESPGLLVRPRPGRTELCAEFTAGHALPAVTAFVAGSAKACAQAVRRPGARVTLPPKLDVRMDRAVHRYGWYVDHAAFGTDLHAASRRTALPRASGGTISAQSHLELAWAAARQALADGAGTADMRAADAMVDGSLPLPTECPLPGEADQPGDIGRFPASGTIVSAATLPPLDVRARPGFTIRPIAATWDFVVFEATASPRTAYACIPRNSLPGFAHALDEGSLDDVITAYLSLRSRHRLLSAHGQTKRPGLYDELSPPAALIAPERDPETGRREPAHRGAKHTLARPGKRHKRSGRRELSRFARNALVIGAAILVLLTGAGVGAALATQGSGGGHSHPDNTATPNGTHAALMTFHPPALSFAKVLVNSTAVKYLVMRSPGHAHLAVKRMVIAGSAAPDFSIGYQGFPGAAGHGFAVPRAVPPSQRCWQSLLAGQKCKIEVTFTPPAPGTYTASLSIYLASHSQPQDISLTGTGVRLGQSSLVSVTGISPATGPITGGTRVTISGSGFTGATGVYFGTSKAPASPVNSDTQITATSPPGNGVVHITVATPSGQSATTSADTFTYVTTQPVITAVSPNAGPIAGATQVTITGNGLGGATGVYFGTSKATVTSDSPTQITATSPPEPSTVNTNLTVDITVTTHAGRSALTRADQFSYVIPPVLLFLHPNDGLTTGGTPVTIYGHGLTGATAVYFGGIEAPAPNVISDTQITTTSPPSASSGTVSVTVVTAGGTSALTGRGQFTYFTPAPPVPAVTSINPSQGSLKGGITVTISGTGFTGATTVSFGTTAATILSDSDTTITVTSPAYSGGPLTVDITVTTPGGTSSPTAADQFTY